ncbi:hypothetical protein RND81_13G067900 [Saponaria officinalis]|uniref:TTF-type domain-containing protein n=1 Tax=Saponaria officinalis TaxID=3572 RepID=A0AAW1GYC0_SAPOF
MPPCKVFSPSPALPPPPRTIEIPSVTRTCFLLFKNDSSPSISVDQHEEIELQDYQHKRASNQDGQHEQQEDVQDYNITSLERDPGKRRAIGIYPLNEQDNVRRAYVVLGPYQPYINDYPCTQHGNQGQKFSHRWFKEWPWLEYSLAKDSVYCFPCFLFDEYPSRHPSFTEIGFNGWKNVMSKQSVSTATTERAFSSMKIIKSKLRNKMNDEFLDDLMVLYIERKYAENIENDKVIA